MNMNLKTYLPLGLLAGLGTYLWASNRYCPVSFHLVNPLAIIPQRSTAGAAGYDIYTPSSEVINPGETKIIDLGWTVAVPKGWYVSLQTRSSLSIKKGIVLANGTEGVIDCDYRDNVKLALRNTSDTPFEYKTGDRLAQLVLKRYGTAVNVPRVFFDIRHNTRLGGLGSTGI